MEESMPSWWLTEAITELRDAIITQAVRDYRKALRDLRRKPEKQEARALMRDVKDFFGSGWFPVLMPEGNSEYLLRLLKEETEAWEMSAAAQVDQDGSPALQEWETSAADQEDPDAWTRKGA